VFLDDIVQFTEKLKEEAAPETKVDLVVSASEVHAAPLVDASFKLNEGDTAKAILAWMSNANSGS